MEDRYGVIAIIDVEGGQAADFFAVRKGKEDEYLSPSVTIDCNGSLRIGVGTILYSNQYRPMLEVIEVIYDDVEKHDLLFPSCSRKMYDFFYRNGAEQPCVLLFVCGSADKVVFRECLRVRERNIGAVPAPCRNEFLTDISGERREIGGCGNVSDRVPVS